MRKLARNCVRFGPIQSMTVISYPPETLRPFKWTCGFQLIVNAESVYLLKFLTKLVQNTYSALTLSQVCKHFRKFAKMPTINMSSFYGKSTGMLSFIYVHKSY